jgi:hypothetical protein
VQVLADMSDEERKLALERYKLLEPHLENGRELRSVSQGLDVSFRTLQRWVAGYKSRGLAGLVRKGRADSGERRTVSRRMREAIEGLALEKPPLPLTSVHRQASSLRCLSVNPLQATGLCATSCSTCRLTSGRLHSKAPVDSASYTSWFIAVRPPGRTRCGRPTMHSWTFFCFGRTAQLAGPGSLP